MDNKRTATVSREDFMKMVAEVTDELMAKPGASAGVMLMSVLIGAKITSKLFPDEEKKPEETPVMDAESLLAQKINSDTVD